MSPAWQLGMSSALNITRLCRNSFSRHELLTGRTFSSTQFLRNSIKPIITHGDTAPGYWQIGNLWKVMATGVQTNNSFTLLDQIVHSGKNKTGGPQTHTHTQDEGLYVVSGQCTFNAGGIHGMVAGPGSPTHSNKLRVLSSNNINQELL